MASIFQLEQHLVSQHRFAVHDLGDRPAIRELAAHAPIERQAQRPLDVLAEVRLALVADEARRLQLADVDAPMKPGAPVTKILCLDSDVKSDTFIQLASVQTE